MRRFRLILAVTASLLVAAVASAPGLARSQFSGNVCGLLSAKQVAKVQVAPPTCTVKPMPPLAVKAYSGYWGKPPTSAALGQGKSLQLDVSTGDATFLQNTQKTMQAEISSGRFKKLSGLGSIALQGTSVLNPKNTAISFIVHKYYVELTLLNGSPAGKAALLGLAKAVAAKL